MREFLNKYGIYVVAAALVVAAVIFFIQHKSSASRSTPEEPLAFFVDEDTNEESVHLFSEVPPLPNSSGRPTLVRATKITCDGGKTSRIVYLEKYTPEAQARIQALPVDDAQRDSLDGLLIRAPAPNSPWLPANSNPGQNLRNNIDCPEGGKPMSFLPTKKR